MTTLAADVISAAAVNPNRERYVNPGYFPIQHSPTKICVVHYDTLPPASIQSERCLAEPTWFDPTNNRFASRRVDWIRKNPFFLKPRCAFLHLGVIVVNCDRDKMQFPSSSKVFFQTEARNV